MILINVHILIITLLILNGNAQCTLEEYIETSYCEVSEIKVYGSIPPQVNDADRWAIEAAKTSAQWTLGGLALAGKIAGPLAGIASAGISNLVGAILGTSGNGNIDLMFQNRVNEELNRLQECIDEKVNDYAQRGNFMDVNSFFSTFNELANEEIDAGDVDQAMKEIENFEDLVTDDIRPWIKAKFENPLSNTPAVQYASLVPVFGAFLTTYDQIISAYLSFLKECEYHDAYDAVRSACYDYGEALEEAIIDVDILIQWINTALPIVKNLYDIAKIKSLDLDDRSIYHKRKYNVEQARNYLHEVDFAKYLNGEYMAKGIPSPILRKTSAKYFSVSFDMYGSEDCTLGVSDCNMEWERPGSCSICSKNLETTAGSCRDKLFDRVIGQYNDYNEQVANWEANFIEQYIDPVNDLKRKIKEWMAIPLESEYIGCYKDQSSPRALPVGGDRGYTAETCRDYCKDYILFAIQSIDQCWCGNDIQDAIQYGVSTNCLSDLRGSSFANGLFSQHVTIENTVDSGYCLEEDENGDGDIYSRSCNSGTNQEWILYDSIDSDGYFRIKSVHSGRCLSVNVENGAFGFDTNVLVSDCQDGEIESQRWQIKDNGEIIPKYSTPDFELCLWSRYPPSIIPCAGLAGNADFPRGLRIWKFHPVRE